MSMPLCIAVGYRLIVAVFVFCKAVNLKLATSTVRFSFQFYFEMQALQFPRHQISWVSDWVRDFSSWVSSATEAAK